MMKAIDDVIESSSTVTNKLRQIDTTQKFHKTFGQNQESNSHGLNDLVIAEFFKVNLEADQKLDMVSKYTFSFGNEVSTETRLLLDAWGEYYKLVVKKYNEESEIDLWESWALVIASAGNLHAKLRDKINLN